MTERKEPSKEEIAHRAYELYVQRGAEPGKDLDDWTRAEKELNGELVITKELSGELLLSPKTKAAQAGRSQSN